MMYWPQISIKHPGSSIDGDKVLTASGWFSLWSVLITTPDGRTQEIHVASENKASAKIITINRSPKGSIVQVNPDPINLHFKQT